MRDLDVPMTWAIATVATAVAILAYAAIGLLARRVLRDEPPVILAVPDPGRRRTRGGRAGTVLVTVAVALAVWWGGLALLDLSPFFAKRPDDVVRALFFAPDAGETRATLAAALGETARLLLPGYLAGLAAGAGLAVLLTLLPALGSVAMPLALALRSVPIVTTAPLVVMVLGRGASGTIALVAIMVFFPTLVACLHGLRQAPGRILEVFDSYGAGPLERMIRVRIPAMLPAFFAAARMGVPASVLAVTVVEWLATGIGIGSLMAMSASLSDYDMLWSAVVVVSVVSALLYAAVGALERRVLSVYAPEQLA
jgi:ABC-type nitrate/sulfonate/bicarbonate transport system permease component